jgi:glycosyltransferase involved in cell wall biosynthesis
VTDARIACLKAVDVRGEAAVFVTHSPDGLIKPHVVFYLSALHRHGIGVVLLIVADCPVEPLPDEQLDLLAGVYVRENKGYDFAAWAHVLQLHPELFAAPILYFLNDSIFGPLNEVKFSTLLERIRASDSDFIGLTDSEEHEWHMQSYFLACKNAALSSAAFHRFINGISSLADKDDVIRNYELKFAAYVRDRGLKVEVVFDAPYTANPERPHNKTLFYWKGLIEEGFPFVKVGAIRRDDPLIDIDDWEAILTREGYDTQLVEKTLTLTAKPVGAVAKPAKAQRHELLAVPVTWPRAADAPLKVALIGPWNYDNGLGFASRGYLAALWHTNFLVNIHPIRTPFHIHRQMAPMVEYRSFSGDADLVIVHLNPDGWFSVLTDEQRAIIARAGKVVGAWVWETQNIPENWYPGFDSVHAIWAPSKYCAEVFASASRAPVEVVPYFIAVRPPSLDTVRWEALRRDLEIELGQRMILYCFDGASYLVRKNPGALVAAFERSGLAADGWLLVLKTKNLFDSPAQGQQLSELVARTPGVRLINQSYDPALMDVLMNIADIYASPHCSEGFGMTIAEAMALGKVVVATDFAGSRDFVDETCGYPVPYRLHALTEDYGHYLSGSVWADVDQEALAALLRTAADRVVRGDHSIGRAARGRILQHYSPQAIGDAMQRAAAALFGA